MAHMAMIPGFPLMTERGAPDCTVLNTNTLVILYIPKICWCCADTDRMSEI